MTEPSDLETLYHLVTVFLNRGVDRISITQTVNDSIQDFKQRKQMKEKETA